MLLQALKTFHLIKGDGEIKCEIYEEVYEKNHSGQIKYIFCHVYNFLIDGKLIKYRQFNWKMNIQYDFFEEWHP